MGDNKYCNKLINKNQKKIINTSKEKLNLNNNFKINNYKDVDNNQLIDLNVKIQDKLNVENNSNKYLNANVSNNIIRKINDYENFNHDNILGNKITNMKSHLSNIEEINKEKTINKDEDKSFQKCELKEILEKFLESKELKSLISKEIENNVELKNENNEEFKKIYYQKKLDKKNLSKHNSKPVVCECGKHSNYNNYQFEKNENSKNQQKIQNLLEINNSNCNDYLNKTKIYFSNNISLEKEIKLLNGNLENSDNFVKYFNSNNRKQSNNFSNSNNKQLNSIDLNNNNKYSFSIDKSINNNLNNHLLNNALLISESFSNSNNSSNNNINKFNINKTIFNLKKPNEDVNRQIEDIYLHKKDNYHRYLKNKNELNKKNSVLSENLNENSKIKCSIVDEDNLFNTPSSFISNNMLDKLMAVKDADLFINVLEKIVVNNIVGSLSKDKFISTSFKNIYSNSQTNNTNEVENQNIGKNEYNTNKGYIMNINNDIFNQNFNSSSLLIDDLKYNNLYNKIKNNHQINWKNKNETISNIRQDSLSIKKNDQFVNDLGNLENNYEKNYNTNMQSYINTYNNLDIYSFSFNFINTSS